MSASYLNRASADDYEDQEDQPRHGFFDMPRIFQRIDRDIH